MNKTTVARQVNTASFFPHAQGSLQRKCACGNHTVAGGECAECAKKKSGLQRKLAIGASNDPLEREADRVADQVMAVPAYSAVSGAPPRIQRYAGQATESAETAPASVDRVLAGSGRPLEPALQQDMWQRLGSGFFQGAAADLSSVVARGTSGGGHTLDRDTREFMESRFGRDFGSVRVHTGPSAEESARSIGAVAYTVGNDIVFGAGHYTPHTTQGRRLLSHELTHTIQQGNDTTSRIGRVAAPAVHTGAQGLVQMVGECTGKSKGSCAGSCVHANGNPGTCRWSGTIANGCVCYENPKLSPAKQVIYELIMAALIAAGIVLTLAAIAAIVACLMGPCEAAALIAAVGFAAAMIVIGIIKSVGGGTSEEGQTAAAGEGGTQSGDSAARSNTEEQTTA